LALVWATTVVLVDDLTTASGDDRLLVSAVGLSVRVFAEQWVDAVEVGRDRLLARGERDATNVLAGGASVLVIGAGTTVSPTVDSVL